jgi:hypothetical protein
MMLGQGLCCGHKKNLELKISLEGPLNRKQREIFPLAFFINRPLLGPCFVAYIIFFTHKFGLEFAMLFKFETHSVLRPLR